MPAGSHQQRIPSHQNNGSIYKSEVLELSKIHSRVLLENGNFRVLKDYHMRSSARKWNIQSLLHNK